MVERVSGVLEWGNDTPGVFAGAKGRWVGQTMVEENLAMGCVAER